MKFSQKITAQFGKIRRISAQCGREGGGGGESSFPKTQKYSHLWMIIPSEFEQKKELLQTFD